MMEGRKIEATAVTRDDTTEATATGTSTTIATGTTTRTIATTIALITIKGVVSGWPTHSIPGRGWRWLATMAKEVNAVRCLSQT